ncbi:MAG: amino acid ABC transporter permease [Candidatus Dactylopiibacterium carminicum]|uniref:Glutamate/aspartate import permease protein GltK n=1 Tax=Candidatus Dactylopiibacterium carminicum TaxID=857335 RepID=A0A272EUK9_9RHOO|nr:amino acid ABC transporter permease [Candidatus Dactylopiibacterium carminicum]KAF7599782.1 amino acid ABC transporter permease [Candidatus Dactylopiibacterium carminicum]PAS93736.1 MAG: amino acid ABC transporter permease [Candidatus Dactylopiibacterium carminicum]PAS98263.1 MAG: amino acid ABC transporter permease [Candidatus Dactylopiibacterium carminicum]PAS99783.1 MAG: amino acid ABC transporter permease [Candidatus Dactylopiibacterium carminicum]
MLGTLDFSVIPLAMPAILKGLWFSLELTVIAMIGGVILGTLLALARLSGGKFIGGAAKVYVDLMRSIPLLMMILWFFFLIPFVTGQPIGQNKSAIITFTLFQAAFYSEIMRAGIQSIPRGQVNAALAIGMTYWQTMGYVVLPQAFRNMVLVLLTQTFILFQDTSLVYAIGATDLLKAAENAGMLYGRTVEMYLFVSVIYFAICFSLSMFVKYMNKRIAIIR